MSDINVFIVLNLGCEMLYVIDQRLRAQNITLDKSVQVIRDITGVLLDPIFIDRLVIGSKQKAVLTEEHCKFILNDFACCSLMRLDESSMSKLWDLITMIFKWQLEMARNAEQLFQMTFRHLEGVGQLYPSSKKATLIDRTKSTIGAFWTSHNETKQEEIFASIRSWFEPINTKISVLIRMGFQNMDGTLAIDRNSDRYGKFADNIGENVYNKHESSRKNANEDVGQQFKGLAQQLNIATESDSGVCTTTTTLLFDDDDCKPDLHSTAGENIDSSEFVQLKTVHTATSSWECILGGRVGSAGKKDLQTLLNTKLS